MEKEKTTFEIKTGTVGESKIAGFLGTFDERMQQQILHKLNGIYVEASGLKKGMESNSNHVPKKEHFLALLDDTSSIIQDNSKDPVSKAITVGQSFGSTIKLNQENISKSPFVRKAVSNLIYNYIDIAKVSSNAELRSLALKVAETFQNQLKPSA